MFVNKQLVRNREGGPARAAFGPVRAALGAFAGLFLALMLAENLGPASALAATTPIGEVRQVVDTALPVLRDRSAPLPQRRRQLRGVLENHFDFRDMARTALGYHWRDLSPNQRDQFVQLFTAFIENAYLSKIQDYSGQDVVVIREKAEGPGFAKVNSQVVQTGKQPIRVDYLLRQVGGGWKIYDVTVDNISIIANYRNQFNRVINDRGFDKLMADMRAKQQQLQASLGS